MSDLFATVPYALLTVDMIAQMSMTSVYDVIWVQDGGQKSWWGHWRISYYRSLMNTRGTIVGSDVHWESIVYHIIK